MGRNLSMLQKGLLLFAAPVLFQLVFFGALLKMERESFEAQSAATQTQDVITQTEMVFRSLIEAINSSRGYVITGNELFKTASRDSIDAAEAEISRLYTLVPRTSERGTYVDLIEKRATALIHWLERVDHLLDANQREQAIEEIKNLEGKHRTDDLRAAIDEFLDEQRLQDAHRRDELDRSWRLQNRFLISGLIAVLGITLTILFVFYLGISRRLELLAEKARLVAQGRPLTPPMPGTDEISLLDQRFHEMAKSLVERNQENELFTYSVSHDLRSPLVNLQGFSEELTHSAEELQRLIEGSNLPSEAQARVARLLRDDIPESIHFIQTAVARMATIIDALLRLSRAGRVEYRLVNVDVTAIVRRVVDSLHNDIDQHGARVSVQELPEAWGDATAIEQLFANLISNAVNYLDPDRPGTIEIGAIDAHDSGTNGRIIYYVKDNGLGIPKDYQSKLFLAFQRFHPGVSRGEGIGLALVHRIVNRHGGQIWARSAPGHGTTFYVSLATRKPTETPSSIDSSISHRARNLTHDVPVTADRAG